jgi:hypothetical protein
VADVVIAAEAERGRQGVRNSEVRFHVHLFVHRLRVLLLWLAAAYEATGIFFHTGSWPIPVILDDHVSPFLNYSNFSRS